MTDNTSSCYKVLQHHLLSPLYHSWFHIHSIYYIMDFRFAWLSAHINYHTIHHNSNSLHALALLGHNQHKILHFICKYIICKYEHDGSANLTVNTFHASHKRVRCHIQVSCISCSASIHMHHTFYVVQLSYIMFNIHISHMFTHNHTCHIHI